MQLKSSFVVLLRWNMLLPLVAYTVPEETRNWHVSRDWFTPVGPCLNLAHTGHCHVWCRGTGVVPPDV